LLGNQTGADAEVQGEEVQPLQAMWKTQGVPAAVSNVSNLLPRIVASGVDSGRHEGKLVKEQIHD
jgi:hypothetical protein